MAYCKTKVCLFGIIALCLATSLLYAYLRPASILPEKDSVHYDAIGLNLALGQGFSLDGEKPTALRGPVYPLFLAGIYALAGHNYQAVWAVQVILHLVNCWLIFLLAKTAYREQVGLAAALLYALYPAFAFYPGLIMTETVTLSLLLAAMLLLAQAVRRDSLALSTISGLFLGLATLCKPTTLLFPLFLGLIWLIQKRGHALVRYGLLLTLSMILVIAPWTIRNYLAFGKVVPVSVFAGYNLLLGTIPRNDTTFDLAAFAADYWTEPISKDRAALLAGVNKIAADPVAYASMMPSKLVYFLLPDGMFVIGDSQTPQAILLILYQLLLLGLAFVGWRHTLSSPTTLLFLSLVVYFVLMHLVIISTPRFNVPIMPYILILSAVGLKAVYRYIRQWRAPYRLAQKWLYSSR